MRREASYDESIMAAIDAATEAFLRNAEDVAGDFGTSLTNGLTADEAAQRLLKDGANELRAARTPGSWQRLLSHFRDPLVYLLMGAIAVSLLVWALEGSTGWPVDAIVISAVVLFNAALGYAQEAKAVQAVAALGRLTAATSAVIRDGLESRIRSADLVRGDLLVLREGDSVGADGRLLQAASLLVQEAALTGESSAVLKGTASLEAPAALGDQLNMVFQGTSVLQGTARAVVTATGMASQIGLIAHLMEASPERPTPLQVEVARLGRMLGIAVVAVAAVVMATLFVVSDIDGASDVVAVLLLGVALAVAAVPEGLPAILSVVLALGVQRMARHEAIVKKLSSVETLGCASVICSDKTGTLTRSEMTIEQVLTASGGTRFTGVGYAPDGSVQSAGMALAEGPLRAEQIVAISGGSLAGNADLRQSEGGAWLIQGDPTEAAFLVAERKLGVSDRRLQRFERVAEIPFTSDRKMMSVIANDHEHGGERVLVSKGAPDVLLARCTQVRVGNELKTLDAAQLDKLLGDVDTLSDAALRTLAVAYRPLAANEDVQSAEALERCLIFVGTAGIIDPPREEAVVAIREAHGAGIRTVMITGDHPRTAARIAADLGITPAGAKAITGIELDAIDDTGLKEIVRTTSVFARVSPHHKLRIVQALQGEGHVVAMTGDGVNDAPALKAADIGVAMGVTGTEVSKQAARMILADDNFATIIHAVREGRAILDNIRKCLRYLLSSNMGEVMTVFLGVVGAGVIGLTGDGGTLVLPLLATQLLWINLITDAAPALALGVDPASAGLMDRKPRHVSDRLIDARMWTTVVQSGLVIAAVTLLTIDFYLPGGLIKGSSDFLTARTAGFTVLVFTSLLTCFTSRSETDSVVASLWVNPWLWAAVALSALLQVAVVHVPFLNLAFGTVPLSLSQWGMCAAMASLVLWVSEVVKLLGRIRRPVVSAATRQQGDVVGGA